MQYAVSLIIIASQDSKTTTLNYGWLWFKNCLLNQFTSYLIVRLMSSSPIKKNHSQAHKTQAMLQEKKENHIHTYIRARCCSATYVRHNYLSILSSKDRAISRSIIPNLFWRLMESRGRKWGNEDKERHHREYGNWIRTEGKYNREFASTLKRNYKITTNHNRERERERGINLL